MYGYIYLTTNLVNGKKYVGKHKSSYFNPEYKGSGKLIKLAFEKYGWSNFKTELLEECLNESHLNQQERYWISFFDAAERKDFYNLSNGGEGFGGLSGDKNPAKRPDVQMKMKGPRPQMKGENNPNYQGRSTTQEQRDKRSRYCHEHYQGENNPMYGRRGELSPHYGKVHVNNGIDFITVPVEELDSYLSKGYVRTKNKSIQGRVYMNNGINSILINSEEVDKFISLGWSRGKKNLPITHTY